MTYRTEATRRGGFTFLEVLMVVVIALLAASIAVPAFLGSYEGAKLRLSARTILMAHRYARSIAVLQGKQVAIIYDRGGNKLEIVALTLENGAQNVPANMASFGAAFGYEEDETREASYSVTTVLNRELEGGIRIIELDMTKEGQVENDTYWVNYFPSGMCDKYSVRLEDKNSKTARVEIDHLSGSVEVIYEG